MYTLSLESTQVNQMPGNQIQITTVCPFCQKPHSFYTDADAWAKGLKAYQDGANIQYAFPFLTPSERELMMTGTCDECWKKI